MLVSPKDILTEENRIPAMRWDGETGFGSQASICFVDSDILQALTPRIPDEEGAENFIDVQAGSVITAWRTETGPVMQVKSPSDIIEMREEMRNNIDEDEDFQPTIFTLRRPQDAMDAALASGSGDDRVALFSDGGSNDILWMKLHSSLYGERRDEFPENVRDTLGTRCMNVARAIGESVNDASFLRAAHVMSITDRFSDFRLPDGFDRYVQVQAIRGQISRLDPDHADALGSLRSLTVSLRDRGLDGSIVHGGIIRGPMGQALRESDMAAMAKSNEALNRKVFGVVTRTPITDLGVNLIAPSKYREIQEAFSSNGEILSGEWVDHVNARFRNIIQSDRNGYHFETTFARVDNRDVLMVYEPSAPVTMENSERGAAYIYSWPSDDRQPILEVGQEEILPMVSDADIPSEDEVSRLSNILSDLYQREMEPDTPQV